MSYSQNDEEEKILTACHEPIGTLLDIGAYDGITRSNSLALIERGWNAILVEPSPNPFLQMLELHRHRMNVELVNCAVDWQPDIPIIHLSDDGVSTTEEEHHKLWKETAIFHRPSRIVCVTIRQLAQALKIAQLDFVTIDTEGTNTRIFRSFPFDLFTPRLFCIEKDRESGGDALINLGAPMGYELLYETSENILLRKVNA